MLTINVSGNITGQPVLRTINSNNVINFTVAHNERYKNSAGQQMERVVFVRCAIWNKPELMTMFFKGRSFSATGRMQVDIYNDQPQINMTVTSFQVFGKGQPKPQAGTEPTSQQAAPVATAHQDEQPADDLPF